MSPVLREQPVGRSMAVRLCFVVGLLLAAAFPIAGLTVETPMVKPDAVVPVDPMVKPTESSDPSPSSAAGTALGPEMNSRPAHASPTASGSVSIDWIKPILALLTVFGIMAGIVWILKKSKAIYPMPKGLLKQIARLPLSAKESIAVVECQDTWLVVGVTAHQITLLHSFPKDAFSTHTAEVHDIPFKAWFDSTLSRFRPSEVKSPDPS